MKIFERTGSRRRFFRGGLIFGGGLLAVPASEAAPANETLKSIHSLRTIHGDFSDKPVPDESVQGILDATVRAANASNSQTYSIIVSRDPAKIQKLTGTARPACCCTAPITPGPPTWRNTWGTRSARSTWKGSSPAARTPFWLRRRR